jgi:hypothetical protein
MKRDADVMALMGRTKPHEASGWARSHAGERVLAGVLEAAASSDRGGPAASSGRRRRWLVPVGVAGAAVLAAAATNVLSAEPRNPDQVMCYAQASLTSDAAAPPALAVADPVSACAQNWATLWPSLPQPVAFARCVVGTGGQVVIPVASRGTDEETACGAIGARTVAAG